MKFRRFRSWLRLVFAPDWLVWTTLVCVPALWLFQQGLSWSVEWFINVFASNLAEHERVKLEIPPMHQGALIIVAGLYGYMRGTMFHPVRNKLYGTWLTQTPWRYPEHLPFGPAHLVAQDALALATLMAFALLPPPLPEFNVLYIPIIFVAAYCVSMVFAIACFDLALSSTIVLVLLFSSIYFDQRPVLFLGGATAAYALTFVAIGRSLRDFPYTEAEREFLGLVPYEKQTPAPIGLPIVPAARDLRWMHISHTHAALAALTLCAIVIAIASHFDDSPKFTRAMLFIHVWSTVAATLARICVYIANRLPPISLLGRLATRRLIIPGYDVVFLAPVAIILAACVTPPLLFSLAVPPLIAMPISIALTWYLALALPPDLETWQYTGHFRIPAPRRIGKEVVHI